MLRSIGRQSGESVESDRQTTQTDTLASYHSRPTLLPYRGGVITTYTGWVKKVSC